MKLNELGDTMLLNETRTTVLQYMRALIISSDQQSKQEHANETGDAGNGCLQIGMEDASARKES